jgi:hypothetical protein
MMLQDFGSPVFAGTLSGRQSEVEDFFEIFSTSCSDEQSVG